MRKTKIEAYNEVIKHLNLPSVFKKKLRHALELCDEHRDEMFLTEVWLFGSCAREDVNVSSDIDLFLVTTAKTEKEVRIKCDLYDIWDDTEPAPVQTTVRKQSRIWDETDFFQREVMRDKILLRKYRVEGEMEDVKKENQMEYQKAGQREPLESGIFYPIKFKNGDYGYNAVKNFKIAKNYLDANGTTYANAAISFAYLAIKDILKEFLRLAYWKDDKFNILKSHKLEKLVEVTEAADIVELCSMSEGITNLCEIYFNMANPGEHYCEPNEKDALYILKLLDDIFRIFECRIYELKNQGNTEQNRC